MMALCFAIPSTQAAWQTTPYIALYDPPQHRASQALPYSNVHAPKGGFLVIGADGSFDNLNGMNGKGTSPQDSHYLFDSLMSKSLDEVGVYYPLLAEKVSYDPTRTHEVIFHLNPRARFTDGRALTAADVKYSFDLYQTQSNYGLQMYLSNLIKTEVLSPHKIKMQFKHQHQPEMLMTVAQMPIYAKHEWQQRNFQAVTLKPILGSGPYMIQKMDAGRRIHYQRNPDYWGKDLWVNRGRYNFDQIQYQYFRSPEVKFEAFKSGRLTIFEEKQAHLWQKNYQFPAVQKAWVTKRRFAHQNIIPTQSLVLNTRRSPLNDIVFRQALTFAYDFEWSNQALFAGQYQRLNSFFSNSELASAAKPSADELALLKPYLKQLHPVQAHWVQRTWQYPKSDASGFNRANLLTARHLLLEAGYTYRQGKLHNRQGKAIHLEFLLSQTEQQKSLMPYLRHLNRLGIQTTLRTVDTSQYYQRLMNYDFDMVLDQMPQSLTPGQEQRQLWGSDAATQVGNYNYAGIQNPVIDAMIEKLLQAQSRQQVKIYTRTIDRLLRAGFYHIPTYGTGEYRYAYWKMYHQPKIQPKFSVGLDYWWSDAAQQKLLLPHLNLQ